MDSAALVELSSALPGIVLKEHRHWTSITFRGRGFAWARGVRREQVDRTVESTVRDGFGRPVRAAELLVGDELDVGAEDVAVEGQGRARGAGNRT